VALLDFGGADSVAEFVLNSRLQADTVQLADWPLSSVRLMNDRTWPWLILVPRRPDLRELHDLSTLDMALLVGEMAKASRVVAEICQPDKVNVGALGNIVQQLHIHIVGRFRTDPAWPGPVWSFRPPVPYRDDELAQVVERLQAALG
jgi:diadenosine tetraphosphate (Ap4A) HIT family hydrolase